MTKLLRIAVTTLALSAVALPVLAAETAADTDPVVGRVDGVEIHRSEVVHELQALGPQAQQIPQQMLYPQLLQKVITTKLVAKQGYAAKMENDKEVKEALKLAQDKIVADVFLRHTIEPKITEDKIKARYEEMKGKFKSEDEVRASHILVPTEAEANDVIKQLKDGGDFAAIAKARSKDTGSAAQGGDLGYFAASAMVKPFADAAFGMKNGEVSEKPVKTEFGYHVIKVQDHRKSAPPALGDVHDQLANQLGNEMVQAEIKELTTKAKIEKFNIDGTPMKEKEKEAVSATEKK